MRMHTLKREVTNMGFHLTYQHGLSIRLFVVPLEPMIITIFEIFTNEFVTIDFIKDLKNRSLDIAAFYEANKKYNKVIEIYKMLLLEFPDSERLLKSIGNTYLTMDKKDEAEKYFQQAKEISENKN